MKKHAGFPLFLSIAAMSFGCQCACGAGNIVRGPFDGGRGADGSVSSNDGGNGVPDAGNGTEASIGPGQWNPTPQDSNGVAVTDGGGITLSSGNVRTDYAWIANCTGATVSKIDTKTGKEVARYWAIVPVDGLGHGNGLHPNPAGGCFSSGATSPSRTAVDLNGDVFIANRAPDGQGSVTKVANIPIECIDRNGDGVIQTSSDLNGDGVIDPQTEMFPPADANGNPTGNLADPTIYDECLLWTQPVGGTAGGIAARAIAIDQGIEGNAGNVWVGIHKEAKFYKLDNATGSPLPVGPGQGTSVSIPFGPYGAVVDGQGRLFAVEPGTGHLTMINTQTGIADGVDRYTTQFACLGSYGMGIDGKGRIWLPGLGCGAVAFRYDPSQDPNPTSPTSSTTAWTEFDLSSAQGPGGAQDLGRGRGIAADAQGYVWMTADQASSGAVVHLVAFQQDTPGCSQGTCSPVFKQFANPTYGAIDYVDATDSESSTAIGVAPDSNGSVWVNAYSGAALGVDQTTGVVTKRYIGGNLYTYSDFTGYALAHFTAPRGWYNSVFNGCSTDGADTVWKTLSWQADTSMCAGGTKCQIQVFVKVANSPGQLNAPTTKQYGPFNASPVDLAAAGVPQGGYILVQTVLLSLDKVSSPILYSVDVTWSCPGMFR